LGLLTTVKPPAVRERYDLKSSQAENYRPSESKKEKSRLPRKCVNSKNIPVVAVVNSSISFLIQLCISRLLKQNTELKRVKPANGNSLKSKEPCQF